MADIKVNPTDKLVFDLHMLQIDYNDQKKRALKKEIAEKYGVPVSNVIVNFVPITTNNEGEKISLTSDIINNIQDPQFQLSLIKDYMELKEIKDVDFEEIKAIDTQVNSFVDFDSYSKYKSYKFKYIKWNNYLSYGPDNYFDFTKLHGLVLLNGEPENQSGKTTFAIDLLRFALFGKAQKSPTLDSVFNIYLPEATEVMVEAGIEIEGEDYVIRRTITRPALSKRTNKSKSKQKVEYFKLNNGSYELIENCEGETGAETNNIIRESVGSVEDFNLVISATAYTLGDLLRMGQSDKGKLFSRWLGLLSLEKKEEIAKDLWKKQVNPSLLSNKYDKQTLLEEIKNFEVCVKDNEKLIADTNVKLNESNDRITKYNNDKMEELKKRKEIKDELSGLDVTTIENNIKTKNDELSLKRAEFKQYKDEYIKIKDITYDEDEHKKVKSNIEETTTKKNNVTQEITEIKTKIGVIREDNKRINKLMENDTCPSCGHKIDAGEQQKFIDANDKKVEELIKQGVEKKKELDSHTEAINKLNETLKQIEEKKETVHKKNNLQLRLTALKTNMDNIKLVIENLEKQKKEYETNKENIKYNNLIDSKINTIDASVREETKVKEQHIKQIQTYNEEIKTYNKEVDNRNKIITKLTEEEKIIRNWTIYQQLMGKNGIVKIVLKRALPIINNEIARMLQGLCDFEVSLSISDDNKVCLDLVRDGKSLDLGVASSGLEGTMASLALRSALGNASSMPKPNCLIIDEVLGAIALSNFDNVRELYNRIMTGYDFIIHICHEPNAVDWHDTVITVTKDKETNVSKIVMK